MTVNNHKPTDSNGVEIEPGDLIVSNGKIGIVSKINSHNAPTIRFPRIINVYAWEWGAPDVEEIYNKWDHEVYHALANYEERRAYKGEPATRMVKDKRVVGSQPGYYTTNRQTTYDTTVIRKHNGSTPSNLLEMIAHHEILFPAVPDGPTG